MATMTIPKLSTRATRVRDFVAAGLIYLKRYPHARPLLCRLLAANGATEHQLGSKTLLVKTGIHLVNELGIANLSAGDGDFAIALHAIGHAVKDMVAIGLVEFHQPKGHMLTTSSGYSFLELGRTGLPKGARYTLTAAGLALARQVG